MFHLIISHLEHLNARGEPSTMFPCDGPVRTVPKPTSGDPIGVLLYSERFVPNRVCNYLLLPGCGGLNAGTEAAAKNLAAWEPRKNDQVPARASCE